MSKKTKEFLVKLQKRLKKLIPILHSSEVVSGFKYFIDKLKEVDAFTLIEFLTSVFLFLSVIGLFVVSLITFNVFGGLF